MLVIALPHRVWLDRSQPVPGGRQTYALLIALCRCWRIVIAAATWRNWWLDARLAVATHGIDMAVFTAIVFSANGYDQPVLPVLRPSAAFGRDPLELARDGADRDGADRPLPHRRAARRRHRELRARALRRPQRPPADPFAAADLVRDPPALRPGCSSASRSSRATRPRATESAGAGAGAWRCSVDAGAAAER